MNINDKIYVAGHKGLVGSEIVKKLEELGFQNIIKADRKDVDLTNQTETDIFFNIWKPDYVILAAARVGGIYANSTFPADFTYENLMVECNIIKSCHKYNVKKLLYLGSSCFKPGTLVSTSKGFKNIEDVKIGDSVLTHRNNFKKVYHLSKKEYKGDLKRIKFFGWGDVFCTPEHEILTKSGYKRADELNQDDYVLVPLNIPKNINDNIEMFDDDHKIMYNSYKDILKGVNPSEIIKKYDIFKNKTGTVYGWKRGNVPQYSHMKNDILDLKDKLSELCGYFLAEGWLSGVDTGKRGGRHDVMLSPGYDKKFADDIKFLMENIFGIKTHFGLYETSYKVGYHSNKMAFKFFKQFYSDEIEHKAHTKMIPEFIMNSSNDSIKQLIKAYWRGDGHYTMRKDRNNGQYIAAAASTSKILIYQLQQLLLRFGIVTTINFRNKSPKAWIISKKHNDRREVNQRVQWELKITGKYAIDFIENILDVKLENPFEGNFNSHYYSNFSDKYLEVRVRKTTDIEYNGFVYDLSVEDDVSYTANGIAVHNCIYPRDCAQPIKEEYLLSGPLEKTNDGYAISKIAGIIMCQKFNSQYGTNFISIMPTNLYGSINDNYDTKNSHVLPGMIRKFHDAKMSVGHESVELWGTGSPYREFLHVSDMADASIFLMNSYDSSEIINVGSGIEITIKNLALMIKEIVGYEGKLRFNSDYPDGTPRKLLDTSKLRELGWTPKIDLYHGIKRTYEELLRVGKF